MWFVLREVMLRNGWAVGPTPSAQGSPCGVDALDPLERLFCCDCAQMEVALRRSNAEAMRVVLHREDLSDCPASATPHVNAHPTHGGTEANCGFVAA